MGGGFFSGKSSTSFAAVRPPRFPSPAGATRGFHTHPHSLAEICSEQSSSTVCSGAGDGKGESIFGPVPSRIEVERAISDLQRFMQEISASQLEVDGIQGLMCDHEGKMLQDSGFAKFYDAFSMMQTEPALQSMVISVSCDRAVWEAIMSNKAVQDLQSSNPAVKEQRLLGSSEEQDISILVVKWIMGFTRSKIMELLEKFGFLVSEIIQPAPKEKPTSELTDLLEEKIRSSLLLSLVILLVVVVTRNQG